MSLGIFAWLLKKEKNAPKEATDPYGTYTIKFYTSENFIVDVLSCHLQKCEILYFFDEEDYGCLFICFFIVVFSRGGRIEPMILEYREGLFEWK